jgi:hypothetical protein
MFAHAASLKHLLHKVVGPGRRASFIVMGDLNTMGLKAPRNDKSELDADEELSFLERRMASVGMVRLPKTHEASWWNGKDEARAEQARPCLCRRAPPVQAP